MFILSLSDHKIRFITFDVPYVKSTPRILTLIGSLEYFLSSSQSKLVRVSAKVSASTTQNQISRRLIILYLGPFATHLSLTERINSDMILFLVVWRSSEVVTINKKSLLLLLLLLLLLCRCVVLLFVFCLFLFCFVLFCFCLFFCFFFSFFSAAYPSCS